MSYKEEWKSFKSYIKDIIDEMEIDGNYVGHFDKDKYTYEKYEIYKNIYSEMNEKEKELEDEKNIFKIYGNREDFDYNYVLVKKQDDKDLIVLRGYGNVIFNKITGFLTALDFMGVNFKIDNEIKYLNKNDEMFDFYFNNNEV